MNQEGELFSRAAPAIVQRVFVFHHGSGTMPEARLGAKRDDLRRLHAHHTSLPVYNMTGCADHYAHRICNYTARTRGCFDRTDYMRVLCRATCLACDFAADDAALVRRHRVPACVDAPDKNCAARVADGDCVTSAQAARDCPRSCLLCPHRLAIHALDVPVLQQPVAATAIDDEGVDTPAWRFSARGVCMDDYARCPVWAAPHGVARCNASAEVRAHCPYSCGLCAVKPPPWNRSARSPGFTHPWWRGPSLSISQLFNLVCWGVWCCMAFWYY